MGFIQTGFVPNGKVDREAIPVGQETQFFSADEWNDDICQSLLDLRSQILNGYIGLVESAFSPADIVGFSGIRLWAKNTGNLMFTRSGVDMSVAAGTASAKGDLLVFNGTNYEVVPAGTDGYLLTADSTKSSGVSWGAGGGGGFPIGGITGSLTAGRVTLSAGSSSVSDDAGLTYTPGTGAQILALGTSGQQLILTINNSGGHTKIHSDLFFLELEASGAVYFFTPNLYCTDFATALGGSTNRFSQCWSRLFAGVQQNVSSAGAVSIDTTLGEMCVLTPTANISGITLNAGQPAQRFTLQMVQAASATWPTTITGARLAGGTFTKGTGSGVVDSISFQWNSANSTWDEISRTLAIS